MLRYDMTMNQILDHVLGAARQLGASDVHLKAGLPPVFRIKGDLRTLRDTPPLTAEVIGTFAVNLMSDRQREIFDKHHDADLSYGTPDGVRYRVNVFKQRGQTGMVLRIIPPEVPDPSAMAQIDDFTSRIPSTTWREISPRSSAPIVS